MPKTTARISLADLSSAGIILSSQESVALVREVIRQVASGERPGVPSAHVIRLSSSGAVFIEGPVEAGGRPVPRSAQLLESLLPGFDAAGGHRAPGALRLVIARALGTLDLPPYPSLESFAEALGRFAAADVTRAVQDLVARWAAAPRATAIDEASSDHDLSVSDQLESTWSMADFPRVDRERKVESVTSPVALELPALTVSDIRRARRANGVSLDDVSAKSRIPVPLLRQLEWGYLYNWPAGLDGRAQLVQYAQAAGLDEVLVVSALSPLLEEMGHVEEPLSEKAGAPSAVESQHEITIVELDHIEPDFPDEVAEPAFAAEAPAEAAETLIPPIDQPFEEAPPRFADAELMSDELADAVLMSPELVSNDQLAVIDRPIMLNPAYVPLPRRRSQILTSMAAAAAVALAAFAGYWSQIDRQWLPIPGATRVDQSARPATTGGASVPLASRDTAASAVDDRTSKVPSTNANKAAALPTGTAETARSEQRPEALMDGDSLSPAFALVGTAMFYQGEDANAGGVVRVGNDGRGAVLRIIRVVDDNARNFHASPSPDGNQVAFDSDRDGERAVFVADSDGHNVRRVSGDGFAAIPSWSPDGHTLAFVRAEADRPRVWNLWTVDLQSSRLRRLTSNADGQSSGGSWFPDGRRIAYCRDDRIVVLDVAGGRERLYASPRAGRTLHAPAVSPDGRRVMFQVQRDGAWLLDLMDGSMQKVLSDPSADNYTWSPDGRRVAYQNRRSGEWGVWVMAPR